MTDEEKAAKEKADKEAADKLAKEKADKEAADKEAKEKAEKEELDRLGENGLKALKAEREAKAAEKKRADDAEKELKKYREAEEKAAKEKAEAEGNFKALYEAEQKKVVDLEVKAKQNERLELVRKVAKAHNLPDSLADRLKGETEAELAEDAKALAATVKVQKAPDTELGGSTEKPVDTSKARTDFTFVPVGAVAIPD